MNVDILASTAEHWGEIIDCRSLVLSVDYYSLSKKDTLKIAEDVIQWLKEKLLERFWVRHYLCEKGVRKEIILPKIIEQFERQNNVFYRMEAMVLSPVVHDLKTYQSYMRCVSIPYSHGIFGFSPGVSADFADYWNTLFPDGKPEPELLKQNILRIFREEGRKYLGGYYSSDASALVNILPYQQKKDCYYGTVRIKISSFCLNGQQNEMAEALAEFAVFLSKNYHNLNAHVLLCPDTAGITPYKTLFGGGDYTDGSHEDANCTRREWYPTYYLSGAEWFNIVSPLAQQHIPCSAEDSGARGINVKNAAEGPLIVKSSKTILDFGISDALEMKKWLYPALYPGMSSVLLRMLFRDSKADIHYPRNDWRIVPVFEDEINVMNEYLVFSSRRTGDGLREP